MQIVVLPKMVCLELEHLFYRFLWDDSEGGVGLHLVRSDDACRPLSHDGLGFQNLSAENDAFIVKLALQLIARPSALWVRFLRAKYKCTTDIPKSLQQLNRSSL
ncbi:hypothetical protein V6N13_143666 [Hibiscus sabdariffa]